MNRKTVKPQYRNGGGNGNGGPPPPPPATPSLSISITSPANGANVVGNNPGVSLTIVCTVGLGNLSNQQVAKSFRSSSSSRGKQHLCRRP